MTKTVIFTSILTLILFATVIIWLLSGPRNISEEIGTSNSIENEQVLDTKFTPYAPSSSLTKKGNPLVMWSLIEESNIPEIKGYQGNVAGAVPLELKTQWSSEIALGENIMLSIPQIDSELLLTVTRVKNHIRGIKVITATGIEDSTDLLLTLGPSSTFANVGTPKGTYELVGTGSYGWLMPSKNMDPNVDYTKSDYVIHKVTEPSGL